MFELQAIKSHSIAVIVVAGRLGSVSEIFHGGHAIPRTCVALLPRRMTMDHRREELERKNL